ncbi:MAG: phytanoyl-CoA dioxygenase family protein [Parvibaculum sp.]|uniref:phytanoyl-CoA dioxygenase family protein n=1 Tax=Parvibaculum sp. TaxID=2024848 RepID=UPI0025E5ADE2|nr:phytanoyl-CoA dioxygenase family protein [Parvibaculum sp.]MCE9651118.1 phytanoyl-CoA dioxygenase family protein [Parvibaculum sp.]
MTPQQRRDWEEKGFFFLRGNLSPSLCGDVEEEVIGRIRSDPPANHAGETAYMSGANYFIFPESTPSPVAARPEDYISKVFNCHAEGLARQIAERGEIAALVADILGSDIDCFQSQFIFKNPGVIGQPWHQDSYYFNFDKQPQVGVWVALSRATLENGCLWVAPGSHRSMKIFEHVPDRRPEANHGYLEIVDQDTSNQIPVLMEPGDVLFFHSYLIHRSTDNIADERRAAMVYHYGQADTKPVTPERARALSFVNRWIPVGRASQPA